MSGEPLFLADDDSGRIAAYLRVLRGLPAEPRWVLVGGLAVNIRLGRVHRATNDVDTVSEDQPRLVELLVANSEDATKLSAGKVRLRDPEVEVDVMSSTEGEVLPTEESARSFALVRRWTMRSATKLSLGSVAPDGSVTEEVEAEVASRPALVALKAVSIPRRKEGSYPEKVGSDIQDLYRLVEGLDLDVLLAELDTLETEARQWIAGVLTTTFSDKELRYAAMRMHRFAANVDSEGIAEGDLALLAELGAALADKP